MTAAVGAVGVPVRAGEARGAASVIPYPERVVGFVPPVTRSFASTVTDLYVPAVTPLLVSVKLIAVVPEPDASPETVMLWLPVM